MAADQRLVIVKDGDVPIYHEHPGKATMWRDGQFVVMPEADSADATVWFAFDTDGDEQWEGLLASARDDGTATVLSVPFFVYDLALGDEITTLTSAEGPLVAVERVQRSGLLTFRVAFDDAAGDGWQTLMRDLERWSCWFDVRSPHFVAIAAPSDSAQDVADYLHARDQAGELQYETGQTSG